jgi:hypothetical protein
MVEQKGRRFNMSLTARAIEVNVDQTALVPADPIFATEPLEFRVGPVPLSSVDSVGSNWAAADAGIPGTLAAGHWYVGFTYMIPVSSGLTLETDLSQMVDVELGPLGQLHIQGAKKLEPANALNLLGTIMPAVTSVRCWLYNVSSALYYMVKEQIVSWPAGTIADNAFYIWDTAGAVGQATIPGTPIALGSTLYSLGVGTQYIGTAYKKWYCITCRNKVAASAVTTMDTGVARILQNVSGTDLAGAYTRIQLWSRAGGGAWKDYTLSGTTGQTIAGVALQHQLPIDNGTGEGEAGASTQHVELCTGPWNAGGTIGSVSITAPGTGYSVGDILTITNSPAATLAGKVIVTGETGGAVTSIDIYAGGFGYTTGAGKATTGGGANNCTVNIVTIDGLAEPIVSLPLVANLHPHTHRYCDGAIIFAFNFTADFPVTSFNIPIDVTWRLNVV